LVRGIGTSYTSDLLFILKTPGSWDEADPC